MSFPTLDETEYPHGSQKRQEKERELEVTENEVKPNSSVPESEWRGDDSANAQAG